MFSNGSYLQYRVSKISQVASATTQIMRHEAVVGPGDRIPLFDYRVINWNLLVTQKWGLSPVVSSSGTLSPGQVYNVLVRPNMPTVFYYITKWPQHHVAQMSHLLGGEETWMGVYLAGNGQTLRNAMAIAFLQHIYCYLTRPGWDTRSQIAS